MLTLAPLQIKAYPPYTFSYSLDKSNMATFSCLAVEVYSDSKTMPSSESWGEAEVERRNGHAAHPLFTVFVDTRTANRLARARQDEHEQPQHAAHSEACLAQLSTERTALFADDLQIDDNSAGWILTDPGLV